MVGENLSKTQMTKVFAGIKPSLDRLGQIFPSLEAYLSQMKQAPYLQPWNSYMETYFRYEVEKVKGGFDLVSIQNILKKRPRT